MKKAITKISTTFLVCFLAACAPSNKLMYTTIDVLRPADVVFPISVNNLLLVNNTIVQPETQGHFIWLLNDQKKPIVVQTDSLSMFLLSALGEDLENRGFFNSTPLIVHSINRGRDFTRINPLTEAQIADLLRQQNADAILSLDKLEVSDLLQEGYKSHNGGDPYYMLGLNVVYSSWWSLQSADNESETKRLMFLDTVFWESSSYNRNQLIDNFPDRTDALIDGALYVGRKMINRLIPYWEETDRYLFEIEQPLMVQGMDSVLVRNWQGAIPLWQRALGQTKNRKQTALIQNNIAIALEISGNLDGALQIITQAIDNYGKGTHQGILLDHRDQLLTRLKQQKLLREQIGE